VWDRHQDVIDILKKRQRWGTGSNA
jgi:hypothetical protein